MVCKGYMKGAAKERQKDVIMGPKLEDFLKVRLNAAALLHP